MIANFNKKYTLAFFLLLPYVGGYIPEFKFAGLTYNGERIFFIGFSLLLFWEIFKNNFKVKVSSITIWWFIFSAYTVINRIVQADLNKPEIINYSLPVLFLLFLDNLSFKPADLKSLTKVLMIVAVGTFLGSLIQLTVDPYFYSGISTDVEDKINSYAVGGGLFRNNSIYRGIGNNEGGIAFAYLSVYFLFMNLYRYQKKFLIYTGLVFFSVCVIFAKYVWISFIIGALFFVWHKYPKNKYYYFGIGVVMIFFIYFFAFDLIEQSTVYQNRVNVTTHEGRIGSTELFLEKFFLYRPLFGYGISSWFYAPYMALYHIGIHVGYFEILFKGGLVGLGILFMFIGQLFRRAWAIKKATGNPIFMAFICIYLFINLTAIFVTMTYYGYYLMMFFMTMYYKLYVEYPKLHQEQLNKRSKKVAPKLNKLKLA